uniref:Methylglutaconyl-CoA hydratase n=1 Tax=Arundo donax TaxID=35708 RepID=A0A0A8Z827_ARUDO
MRISHERANSNPPPKATPSTTAIEGIDIACLYNL